MLVDSASTQSARLKIFTVVWAIATLFHMAHSNLFTTQLVYVFLTLAAVGAVLKPSFNALLILVIVQLSDIFLRTPNFTNHWIFTAFVNLSIVQALLYTIIKRRSFKISDEHFFDTFAPIVRWEVIILYFFAVFHKLNSGFFAIDTSCATTLLQAQHIDRFIPLNENALKANAFFVIVIESLIPILLIIRKTRHLGIFIGIVFHCFLSYSSYNAFYDFSSTVVATYFLFMNSQAAQWIIEKFIAVKQAIKNYFVTYNVFKFILILSLFFFGVVIIYFLNKKFPTYKEFYLHFFWTLYTLIILGTFLGFVFSHAKAIVPATNSAILKIQNTFLSVFPFLVFLNGMCPYLGLKTEISFAMYSNLRTEGGISNHYIIPASFQIFNFQRETVEIISSSSDDLQQLAEEGKQIVLFELKNYVHERKIKEVTFLYQGKLYHYKRGADTTGLLSKNPYILYKLMRFRAFTKNEPQPCTH
ncbi:hypothetical protein [Chryseosolibacter indicus]|uniref:HTTM domain-containing protein n=1 Tax=Chryseosolibacter indicus TaxID=2782351 RepID=A0ABS5VR91_9BACT|nr:hypothetical protein [Chryseosolibacter indicus]MBT1703952.1 hypothetical protein [Chryseosolibacter indicus]